VATPTTAQRQRLFMVIGWLTVVAGLVAALGLVAATGPAA
jgi:hypothetical protein